MEFYQLIKLVLIIQVVLLIGVSAVELHRTTTALNRNSAKTRRGLNSLSEDVADSDSNVSPEIMFFGHCNLETFGCALLSSILVGLSGIFPLLVIPIESGPSLKHGGIVPDPMVDLTSEWVGESEGVSVWPPTMYHDISIFLQKNPSEKDLSDRLMKDYKEGKGYSYLTSGWLKEVFYHPIDKGSPYCFLKAECSPSQRVNDVPHIVWILIEKKTGKIQSAYCTCFAGLGETCNHVAALLFKVDYAWQWGTNNKACTSKPCLWKTPSAKKDCVQPRKLSELKIMKPHYSKGAAAARLKLLLSFAVGALLGDVFLHLLPEAWAHLDKDSGTNAYTSIGLWVITGILMFLIIEKIFGDKDDDNSEEPEQREYTPIKENGSVKNKTLLNETELRKRTISKSEDEDGVPIVNGRLRSHSFSTVSKINVTGYLNLLANVIDNFTHGLAVGGSYLVSLKVGMVTTIAILLHEIPHEIGDFAILLKSGFNRWKAAKAQLLTASGGVIGALTALSAESPEAAGNRTAWILPFTSGGFLYIALVTVVPELLQEKRGRESVKQVLGLIAGVLSMVLVTVLFEE